MSKHAPRVMCKDKFPDSVDFVVHFFVILLLTARDAEEREQWIEALQTTIVRHSLHVGGRVCIITVMVCLEFIDRESISVHI